MLSDCVDGLFLPTRSALFNLSGSLNWTFFNPTLSKNIFENAKIRVKIMYEKNKPRICAVYFILVEMVGVEPTSENSFPQLSTSVADSLRFPRRNAARQAFRFGSPVVCDGLQGVVPVHIYRSWRSRPGRGTPGGTLAAN